MEKEGIFVKKRILSLFLAAALCLVPLTAAAGDLLYGDANDDGQINMKDVLLERKKLADFEVEISEILGDCNGDGTINMKDVLILRQYLAGMIDRIEGQPPTDTKKSLRSIAHYDEDGNRIELNFYTYDSHGNLTLLTDREPDGTLNWKKEYTYDQNDREILCVMTEDDERGIVNATTYDAAGRISAITRTDGAGETVRKITYEYDPDGRRVAEYEFDDEGKMDTKYLYAYDDDSRLVKEELFGGDGFLYGSVTYAYDEAGNTAEILRYGSEGDLLGSEQFVYGEDGNLQSHVYNDDQGELDARVDYTYDLLAPLAQIVPYNFDGERAEWKYVYTQSNPPLSATCFSWNGETVLWKQTYQYIDVE